MKLIVTFPKFSNAPKNCTWYMERRTSPSVLHEPVVIGGCSKCCFVTGDMQREKEELLLISSIILALTFLHLPSSFTSFF